MSLLNYAYSILNIKFVTFQKYLNLIYLIWRCHTSFSVARLIGDEPALAWIMTHDHAKDLCASELGPLGI